MMMKKNHLFEIKTALTTLTQRPPMSDQQLEEWLSKLDLTFNQAAEAMVNIFDNKILEKDINGNKEGI